MVKTKAELSQERAKRLKCLREISGLTRDMIKARYNISRGTLQNWESARFGGLTAKGAAQVIKAMQAEGIQVTHDWLFHGIGDYPSMLNKNSQSSQKQHLKPQSIQELVHFHQNNTDVIDMIASDQCMWPHIHKEDLVAGVRTYQDDILKLINKIAIVQTHEHGTLIRKIAPGNIAGTYHLMVTNLEACRDISPILYNVNIISAAEVIWIRTGHRKPLVQFNLETTSSDEATQAHTEIHE